MSAELGFVQQGDRRAWRRVLWLFVPGVVAAAWSRLPLSWDGSYFLVDLLDHGRPVMLHGRPGMLLLQLPASLAGHLTTNMAIIALAFSVPYVAVPLLSLWLSWRAVRSVAPGLLVWAALAIGFVTLPGQAFFVSESLMVAQLMWPLLLSVLVGHRWPWPVTLLLVALMVALHPMAAPALGVVALGGWLAQRGNEGLRTKTRGVIALAAGAAVLRQVLTFAGVDAETPKLHDYTHQWTWAVNGAPMVVVGAATLSVVLWLHASRARTVSRPSPVLPFLSLFALCVAAGAGFAWGASARAWRSALDYRSFVVAFALPLAVAALVDARRIASPRVPAALGEDVRKDDLDVAGTSAWAVWVVSNWRVAAGGIAAVGFSVTLLAQSAGWVGLQRFARDKAAEHAPGCVVRHFGEKDGTAMRHWANPSLMLIVQGQRPRVVVVGERSSCDRLARTGELLLPRTGKDRNVFTHWFDLSLARAAAAEAEG